MYDLCVSLFFVCVSCVFGLLYTYMCTRVLFFTSSIRRRRRIDPRLAFHMESLIFCMEVDLRRLLRRTPWQRLLLW